MSLIQPKASVDLSPLDTVNQVVKGSAAIMRNYQKVRARQAVRRIRIRFSAPDNGPSYPFIWSYDPAAQGRARRWWFANKGKNGPHKRTGDMERAWDVRFIQVGDGGVIEASNEASGVEYVYGDKQIPSHYLTGWPQADEVVEQEAAVMSEQLVNDWYFVSTGQGR